MCELVVTQNFLQVTRFTIKEQMKGAEEDLERFLVKTGNRSSLNMVAHMFVATPVA